MGSLAQATATGDAPAIPEATTLPELSDADFYREVFHVDSTSSQIFAEKQLLSRATELGIDLPSPITPQPDNCDNSRAQSQNSTIATYHARTFSSTSYDSASTDLTTPSAVADATDSEASSQPAKARRSKDLRFSHYDKYLENLKPILDQPRFFKGHPSPSTDSSAQSLFSVSSRMSYLGFKDGIRRIRWRKKSEAGLERPQLVPPLLV